MVVVNKPSSMPVHPCGQYRHNSVVFILRYSLYCRHELSVSSEPIRIIFQSDDMVVVNKPSSMPVHPCGRYRHNSVVFILGYSLISGMSSPSRPSLSESSSNQMTWLWSTSLRPCLSTHVGDIDTTQLSSFSARNTNSTTSEVSIIHSLSQQGAWASFGYPEPPQITPQDTQIFWEVIS